MFQPNKTRIIAVCAGSSASTKPDIQSFLSSAGADWARGLGEYLKDVMIDIVVCSTATRAQNTKECIMQRRNVETHIIPELYFPDNKQAAKLIEMSRWDEVPSIADLVKTEYGQTLIASSMKAMLKIENYVPVQTSVKSWERTMLLVGHPILLPSLLLHTILLADKQCIDPTDVIEYLQSIHMQDGEALDMIIEGSGNSFSVTVASLMLGATPLATTSVRGLQHQPV